MSGRQPSYVRPPLFSAHTTRPTVVGVCLCLPRQGNLERGLELVDVDVEPTLSCHGCILLWNGASGLEEGSEGVKA